MAQSGEHRTYVVQANNENGSVEHTITVPSGEVWYVDHLVVASNADGGSSDGPTAAVGAVRENRYNNVSIDAVDDNQISRQTSAALNRNDGYSFTQESVADFYADDGDIILVGSPNFGDANGTVDVTVSMRRVR